jgi:hypothetical protein
MEVPDTLKDYISTSKEALELLRAAYTVMPKGAKRDEAEKAIEAAAEALARSDAKLAKDLGYKLCQCKFPPLPMLWQQAEDAWVCPSPQCGHKIDKSERPQVITGRSRLTDARRGRSRD